MSEAKQSQARVLFEEKDEAKATRSQSRSRLRNQNEILIEKSDEAFIHKKNSKKTQIFIADGRIYFARSDSTSF
jgi:uncharacterized phage-like protein YoqJ